MPPANRQDPPKKRMSGTKLAVTLIAAAILLPITLITVGVVAIPVISIPALLLFVAAVVVFSLGRAQHEPLPDEENHER